MPDRENDAIKNVTDSVRQLEIELRGLATRKQSFLVNIEDLEKQRDKLSQEIFDLSKKIKEAKEKAKDETDAMVKSAQEKLDKANTKEAEASGKVAELNLKLKAVEDVIKSNQGLQKNLGLQREDAQNKTVKLEGLVTAIKETLKGI